MRRRKRKKRAQTPKSVMDGNEMNILLNAKSRTPAQHAHRQFSSTARERARQSGHPKHQRVLQKY